MLEKLTLKTGGRCDFIDITRHINDFISKTGVKEGVCVVFVTHTTAGVTINENADPDVVSDLLCGLDRMAPEKGGWRHAEGNSPAHIKTSLVGPSLSMIIHDGRVIMGTWQSVFFCEFDGPRNRTLYVKILAG